MSQKATEPAQIAWKVQVLAGRESYAEPKTIAESHGVETVQSLDEVPRLLRARTREAVERVEDRVGKIAEAEAAAADEEETL